MTELTLNMLAEQLGHIVEEQRAIRNELRRLNENQMLLARTIERQRENLSLLLRTELAGLFAHLETRLELRIDEALRERPRP